MTFRYEICALCLLHTEIVVLMAMFFLCFRIFFIFCLDFATVPCVNVVWDEVFRRMPLSSERYECNDYNLFVHKCTHTPSHTRNALVWATESSFIYRFSIYYSKRVADIRKNIILSILLKSRNDCIWERESENGENEKSVPCEWDFPLHVVITQTSDAVYLFITLNENVSSYQNRQDDRNSVY